MIIPLFNSLNILNLVCLVATEILLMWKLKGGSNFWLFIYLLLFLVIFLCVWGEGGLLCADCHVLIGSPG